MEKEYAKYLLDKTKTDYNLIAKDFSRTRKNPWTEINFLFDKYLTKGEKVLDLGCGNGRYFPTFREKEVDYFGVDNSEELIKIAKNKYPGVKFHVDDALNLSFPNDFFDKVYNIAVLHQIPSNRFRMQSLREIRRVLRPGGLLVLTVWKFHRIKELLLLLKYTIFKMIGKTKLDMNDIFVPWGDKTKRYYHYFFEEELEHLLIEAGFKIIRFGISKNRQRNRQNIYIVAAKPL